MSGEEKMDVDASGQDSVEARESERPQQTESQAKDKAEDVADKKEEATDAPMLDSVNQEKLQPTRTEDELKSDKETISVNRDNEAVNAATSSGANQPPQNTQVSSAAALQNGVTNAGSEDTKSETMKATETQEANKEESVAETNSRDNTFSPGTKAIEREDEKDDEKDGEEEQLLDEDDERAALMTGANDDVSSETSSSDSEEEEKEDGSRKAAHADSMDGPDADRKEEPAPSKPSSKRSLSITGGGKNDLLKTYAIYLAMIEARLCQLDPHFKNLTYNKPEAPRSQSLAPRGIGTLSQTPRGGKKRKLHPTNHDDDDESSGSLSEVERPKRRRTITAARKGRAGIGQLQKPGANLTPIAKRCIGILRRLSTRNGGVYFQEPVDPVKLNIPTYFEVIKNPMDFSTIEEKVYNKKYETVEDFKKDLHLTFDNAKAFNPQGSPVYEAAAQLQKYFVTQQRELPPNMRMDSTEALKKKKDELGFLGAPVNIHEARGKREIKRPERLGDFGVTLEERQRIAEVVNTLDEAGLEKLSNLIASMEAVDENGEIDLMKLKEETIVKIQELLEKIAPSRGASKKPAAKRPASKSVAAKTPAPAMPTSLAVSSTSSSSSDSSSLSSSESDSEGNSDDDAHKVVSAAANEWKSLDSAKKEEGPSTGGDQEGDKLLKAFQDQGDQKLRMEKAIEQTEKTLLDKREEERQQQKLELQKEQEERKRQKEEEEERERKEREQIEKTRAAEREAREKAEMERKAVANTVNQLAENGGESSATSSSDSSSDSSSSSDED